MLRATSPIAPRLVAALTFSVLAIFAASTVVRASSPRIVRVYDTSVDLAPTRAAAIEIAAAILEDASVSVDWRDCSDNSARAECQNVNRARDLIVRMMPTSPSPDTQGESQVTHDDPMELDLRLGFAVVDPRTGAATMATVFHDRVRAVASRTGANATRLLGRALAHEVGHLLLRATGHSATGLMRAVWSDEELALNQPQDWVFSPSDRRRLLAGFSSPASGDLVLSQ